MHLIQSWILITYIGYFPVNILDHHSANNKISSYIFIDPTSFVVNVSAFLIVFSADSIACSLPSTLGLGIFRTGK